MYFRADELIEHGIDPNAFGVVEVFVSSEPGVDRLAQQADKSMALAV